MIKIRNQYTKEESLSLLKDFYNKNGSIKIRDLLNRNGLPSIKIYSNYFGTFQNALKQANIEIPEENKHNFNREKLSDDKILNKLQKEITLHLESHIFLPTSYEISKNINLPVQSTFVSRFGGLYNAYKLLGYNPEEFNKDALEKDMILKYKNLCTTLNKVANSREIDSNVCNGGYAMSAYIHHFGGLKKLQKLCGYTPTVVGKGMSNDEGLNVLRKIYNIIGEVPTQRDLILFDFAPNSGFYRKRFGSYANALKEAGFLFAKKYITPNGIKCSSSYEYKIASAFESYNITYKKEVYYKHVITDFKRNFRFDFEFVLNNKKYYIEMFGILNNEFYNIRKDNKIQICNTNNVLLIDLYPDDIFGKTYKQLYEMIKSKTELRDKLLSLKKNSVQNSNENTET